jgi:hypothetical protein
MPQPWDFRTFLTFLNPAARGSFASAKEHWRSVIDRVQARIRPSDDRFSAALARA